MRPLITVQYVNEDPSALGLPISAHLVQTEKIHWKVLVAYQNAFMVSSLHDLIISRAGILIMQCKSLQQYQWLSYIITRVGWGNVGHGVLWDKVG